MYPIGEPMYIAFNNARNYVIGTNNYFLDASNDVLGVNNNVLGAS